MRVLSVLARKGWAISGLVAMMSVGLTTVPSSSADMPSQATMSVSTMEAASVDVADYAALYANVLLMRTHFFVIFPEDAQAYLADEMARVNGLGLNADIWNKMQRRLQGEIDHFIVELQYVIESDGAVWPEDKPERIYKLDGLAALARIRQDLDAALADGEDLIFLLQELANINALTEGELTADNDAFSIEYRDGLVSSVLK